MDAEFNESTVPTRSQLVPNTSSSTQAPTVPADMSAQAANKTSRTQAPTVPGALSAKAPNTKSANKKVKAKFGRKFRLRKYKRA